MLNFSPQKIYYDISDENKTILIIHQFFFISSNILFAILS